LNKMYTKVKRRKATIVIAAEDMSFDEMVWT
jgi:ribosomal protein L7Ae-like RNA K-turn-binding protein